MTYVAHTEMYNGLRLTISADEDVQSPREEMDNLGTMVCFSRRHNLGDGDHGFTTRDDFADYLEDRRKVRHCKDYGVVMLPLYLYDHSGLAMSTESFNGRAHHAGWDSGQVGYTFATYEDIRREFQVKRVTKKVIARVEEVLRGEVETYDDFLRGNVWAYDIADGEEDYLDSCCGCYGLEYAIEAAREAADCLLRNGHQPVPFADDDEDDEWTA